MRKKSDLFDVDESTRQLYEQNQQMASFNKSSQDHYIVSIGTVDLGGILI